MTKFRCILLPGLDGTGKYLEEFAQEILPYADPFILSYPQQQMSYEALAAYVLAKLPENEDYAIVAESYSGPVALLIANEKPERLKSMVLVATFPKCPFPKLERLARKILPYLSKLGLPKLAISMFLLNGERPDIARAVWNTVTNLDRSVLVSRLQNVFACDMTSLLAGIEIPVLVISPDRDRVLPKKCSLLISSGVRHTKLLNIDAPHFVLQVRSKEMAESVIGPFLQKTG